MDNDFFTLGVRRCPVPFAGMSSKWLLEVLGSADFAANDG